MIELVRSFLSPIRDMLKLFVKVCLSMLKIEDGEADGMRGSKVEMRKKRSAEFQKKERSMIMKFPKMKRKEKKYNTTTFSRLQNTTHKLHRTG